MRITAEMIRKHSMNWPVSVFQCLTAGAEKSCFSERWKPKITARQVKVSAVWKVFWCLKTKTKRGPNSRREPRKLKWLMTHTAVSQGTKRALQRERLQTVNLERQMERFPNPFGFISRLHRVKSQQKAFGKICYCATSFAILATSNDCRSKHSSAVNPFFACNIHDMQIAYQAF